MTTTDETATGFYNSAPMLFDRTEGWAYIRRPGEVYEADGKWYLTSSEAVSFAQHNPEIFSSARAYDAISSLITLLPLAVDPPKHAQYRRVLDPMLSPKVINSMEDSLRAQVGDLIDVFADRGECDAVKELAELFPTQAILTLFGLPLEDRFQFFEWVETLIGGSVVDGIEQATPAQLEAAGGLFGYLQEHLTHKKAHPGDDMLSNLLGLTGDAAWSDAELLGLCFLFVLAGLDTVTSAIGFTLQHLAQRPDLRRQVVENPAGIPPLLEEILRLELPAPMLPRVATREVEVCGVTIPAEARVFVVLATANRESARGAHPDEIDLSKGGRAHLSFGSGIHRCLGSHLARRELRLTVEEFHARIPDYQIADGVRPRIAWPAGTLHLESLPLTFTPRSAR
jgi:cytochrome P450